MKSMARPTFVVDRLHSLPGQRASVLDRLTAHSPPTRLLGGVIPIVRPAPQHTARSERFPERSRARIGVPLRILLGIEVVEIATELVESMYRRQIFVAVAEVVLSN
jgi:hypothetical protein